MRRRQSLDRYVGRAVMGSFVASLVFFNFLMILMDLLNHLGRYLDRADQQGVGTLELFAFLGGYYVRQVPVSFTLIAPFATVIGCMFAIARLMAQNELQPMLFVGRSMVRVLRPALVCGAISALGMVACWQWVVPVVAADVTAAQSFLSGGNREMRDLVLELRDDGFTGMRVHRYDTDHQRLEGIYLLREGAREGDAELVVADAAVWDAEREDWRLQNGVLETRSGTRTAELLRASGWTPDRVRERGQESLDVELFSYGELLELRELRPNRKDVAMALHRHITYPLANLILLLLALPFAIHYERGSKIERVLSAIGVCGAYLLFDLTCQNLGFNGWLHPVVAAWSPTILFGSLGVVMFSGMRT